MSRQIGAHGEGYPTPSSNISQRPQPILQECVKLTKEIRFSETLKYKEIENARTLRSVSLRFPLYHKVQKGEIQVLRILLSNFKFIRSLNLHLVGLGDENVIRLSSSLEYLSSLRILDINFSSCWKIRDRGLKTLFKALKRIHSLSDLSINMSSCYMLTEESIYYLSLALKNLPCLSAIRLNLWQCTDLNDEGLYDLSLSLKNSIYLSVLNLDFSECLNITDQGVKSIAYSLKYLINLSTLSLDFSSCPEVGDQGLNDLVQNLKNMSSLSYVNLNFINSQVTGIELQNAGLELRNLVSISTLMINYRVIFPN